MNSKGKPQANATTALPLSSLLSQALVAFTIECDNAFEARMPHRTTRFGTTAVRRDAPWLVSLVMFENCLRHVDDREISIERLHQLARTHTNLRGMHRWGYVVIGDGTIRATRAGLEARAIWNPLPAEIEERWQTRFGARTVAELRSALETLAERSEIALPDCLPILGYGLYSKLVRRDPRGADDRVGELPLSALLSRVLLALTLAYERQAKLSLAIAANVLRLVPERGVAVRDLPQQAAVSKEAIAVATGFLERHDYATITTVSQGRTKMLALTPSGRGAKAVYERLVRDVEERASARFGKPIAALRSSLETIAPDLTLGLVAPPDGWRAKTRGPDALPHQPMVSHRGGFPDGS